MKLLVSPLAKRDLRLIYLTIARDRPAAAHDQVAAIRKRFKLLLKHPQVGELLNDLHANLRRFSVGVYVIYFRTQADIVEIVRVLHGAQDADAELSD